jgi:Flp pilus assembly protein TadD
LAYEASIDLYPLEGRFWQKKGLSLEALGHSSEAQISFVMARELGYRDLG